MDSCFPYSSDGPAPIEADYPPASNSDSTKRPGDSAMEDAPPNRKARTVPQAENDLGRENAALRDRFRIALYDHATAAGPAPDTSTPGNIESAPRNPMLGWPACEVLCACEKPIYAFRL